MTRSPFPSLPAVLCACLLLSLLASGAVAFSSPPLPAGLSRDASTARRRCDGPSTFPNVPPAYMRGSSSRPYSTVLFESADDEAPNDAAPNAAAAQTESEAARTRETPKLASDDAALVRSIHSACGGNVEAMENAITANLDNMHPRLVVALQMAAEEKKWKGSTEGGDENEGDFDEEFESQMVAVGTALQSVLDVRLRSGRELLAELLDSGEIRKLDSTIGKAAKEGKLDMSFFTVLGMNMKDAAVNQEGETSLSPTLAAGEGQAEVEGEEGQPVGANRLQILQHIYTRAQEELEKNVAPGMGLLNKLLRTEISSIRANQLEHYLCSQKTTITSPDGKNIDLGGSGAPLVSHGEFTEALENTITQIRTLEASGGTDRLSAMNLIESVRQVAKEARSVLVNGFGEESEVVQEFQRELQPVFRPGTKV